MQFMPEGQSPASTAQLSKQTQLPEDGSATHSCVSVHRGKSGGVTQTDRLVPFTLSHVMPTGQSPTVHDGGASLPASRSCPDGDELLQAISIANAKMRGTPTPRRPYFTMSFISPSAVNRVQRARRPRSIGLQCCNARSHGVCVRRIARRKSELCQSVPTRDANVARLSREVLALPMLVRVA
jgi:hypothetical protein